MSEPKAHAKFAASSAERWMNCAGSIQLSEDAPPKISSAAADEGTTAHELMEFALESNIKDVVKFFENEDDKYDLEMRLYIQNFVDFVRSELKPGFDLLVEQKIHLDFLHPTEAFGTVDVAVIEHFGTLHIIDLKYGKKRVDPKDNAQMIYYALGIAHPAGYDFEQIKTTIYQPRAGLDPIKTHTFSPDVLKVWKDKFSKAIDAAEAPGAKAKLTEGAWCFFCPAKIICPQIKTNGMKKALLAFDSPLQPAPKELTPIQLKTILDKSSYLELWIKEVKAYAEEQVRRGVKIEGWGLVPKRGQRVWIDQERIKQMAYIKETVMSPAEVEKQMKAAKTPTKEIKEFMKSNAVSVSSGDKFDKTKNDYGDLRLETEDAD